jgi:hypothetical protein
MIGSERRLAQWPNKCSKLIHESLEKFPLPAVSVHGSAGLPWNCRLTLRETGIVLRKAN